MRARRRRSVESVDATGSFERAARARGLLTTRRSLDAFAKPPGVGGRGTKDALERDSRPRDAGTSAAPRLSDCDVRERLSSAALPPSHCD